ncbi:MAG TPA: hypothetical protein VGL38_15055 [bacterium]
MPFSRWMFPRRALFAVLFCLAATPLFAVLRVSPAVIEAKFENGRASGSFTISSTDARSVRLRVFPVHFKLTVAGDLSLVPMDSTSLAPWMKITPREFTLEPNSERQVRYAIMAPDTVPDGTYWGGLEFLPLPSHQDSLDAQSRIKAIAIVVVPIMADKGRPTYQWSLDPDSMRSVVTPSGVMVVAKVENSGTGRIAQKGKYEVRDASGAVVNSGDTDRLSVLPHSERLLKTVLPRTLPPGQYEYMVTYTSEVDGSKLTGAYHFDVPDTYPDPPQKR